MPAINEQCYNSFFPMGLLQLGWSAYGYDEKLGCDTNKLIKNREYVSIVIATGKVDNTRNRIIRSYVS